MIDRIREAIVEYPKYIISYEIAKKTKKPHYQGIIFTTCKNETYKKRLEKLFPEWKGTRGGKCGLRSFAPVKEDSWEVYIVKDKDIRFRQGYSDFEIEELKTKSYTVNHIDDDVRQATAFMKAYEYVYTHLGTSFNARDIARSLLEYYRTCTKCEANDFQIKCMTKSVLKHFMYTKGEDVYERFLEARVNEIIGNEFVYPGMTD